MAKYNVENEQVEIHIERLFKYSPELVYSAWTDINLLKQWFMMQIFMKVDNIE